MPWPGRLLIAVVIAGLGLVRASAGDDRAAAIFNATGVTGGVVVHVGCGDGVLTAALGAAGGFVVQGLDTDAENVAEARRYIRSQGLDGKVSARQFDGRRLPYTENLVNLLVSEDLGDVSMDEVIRVLCPLGVAYLRHGGQWTKTVKPWPREIDEWTHFLHGADGNPVARDTVVGPPERYQWISGPLWLRSHESDSSVKALVTARGRLFTIADEAPISLLGEHSPLPDEWFLTARDAFNGVALWKVPIKDWGWRAWKPSWFTPRPGDIPLNIQKRLVAVGDKVYVTLGYHAPVSQLDAPTGEVLQTYDGTARTAEILYRDGRLVLTLLRENRVAVALVDASSGKRLWTSESDYGGTTTDYYRFRAMHGSVPPAKVDPTLNTATDGSVIALLDGGDVVGLDFGTGRQKWRSPFPLVEADAKAGNIDAGQTVWTGTLIVRDGVVVQASPNRLAAFSADSGKILWTQPKKYLGHLWYEWKDVFIIGGLVWTWSAELEQGRLEGSGQKSTWPKSVNGYDLHTGKLTREVPLGNIFKTYHHHRCYRDKATVRYILTSRRGTEYVDLGGGEHTIHNWVRGTCHLGMMPANGLQYAPPHPCRCYINEKLNGFNALAAGSGAGGERPAAAAIRRPLLERGPAYGDIPLPASSRASSEDWPAFRHDAFRSGSGTTEVPARPQRLWQTAEGGKIGSPVVAGQQLFVPLVDEHLVMAFNARDGARQWEYITGARIDSPPTYYRGTVLFGSADGWVYCVRAADGRLVWRFHAAPEERFIGAFGQLESAWPVHGSILVSDGTAYFAAGRSSHLDGGIYLFGVDAAGGELRYRTRLEGPSYDVDHISQNFGLPMGALTDILESDGRLIYMREQAFDAKLQPQQVSARQTGTRVYAKGGLLDDSYFKRMPWMFGSESDYGRLLVVDQRAAYFVRMFDTLQGLDPTVYFTPGKKGYLLFRAERQTGKETWQRRIPIRIKAMVATGGVLFVAGPPDVVDPKDPLGAFEGRKGGVLAACDTTDGRTLWQSELPAPPVFNGLAAARGRLYVAMRDGRLACFGK